MSRKVSLISNYESRYQSDAEGETSYRASGKNRLMGSEALVLRRAIAGALKQEQKKLSILDFGCGDGRVLEGIAQDMRGEIPVPLELVGYDIIPSGIESYAKRLLASGYQKVPCQSHCHFLSQSSYYHKASDTRVLLLLGSKDTTPVQFSDRLGCCHPDITISAYGSLCHILDDVELPREQQPRVMWMRALGKITTGQVIINLSKPLEYPEDIEATKHIDSLNGKKLPPHTFLYRDTLDSESPDNLPMVAWQCLTVEEAQAQAEAAWPLAEINILPCTYRDQSEDGIRFLDCLRDKRIDEENTRLIREMMERSSPEEWLEAARDKAGFIFVIREGQ